VRGTMRKIRPASDRGIHTAYDRGRAKKQATQKKEVDPLKDQRARPLIGRRAKTYQRTPTAHQHSPDVFERLVRKVRNLKLNIKSRTGVAQGYCGSEQTWPRAVKDSVR
jgi:hypothetical protein